MAPRKIMIIRHGEKPPKEGSPPHGVDLAGRHSPDQLIPRGWQRAGALVSLFAPVDGSKPKPPLERPTAVFATGISEKHPSVRCQSTVEPVCLELDLPAKVLTAPGGEVEAAAMILDGESAVCLVCWEHKKIQDLVRALTGGKQASPAWHGARFDVTLVLTREEDRWALEEVPQLLLAGDLTSSVSKPGRGAFEVDDD